ncbi:hypothetical protein AAG570_014079 [Ranatra chinensis]|uniref:glutathione transferase n=1 Tax=Ranatra chinensis TaxID=642074 RepID=A0ABD0YFX3_9HEMI
MNRLKLYYDVLSQPSRVVKIFLLANKIEFEHKVVRLGKFEQKTEEFKKVNPLQQVPVIDDGGFILRESVAIMRYLCREKDVPIHWYPKESKAQAKVDEYLEWQHLGTRMHCGLYFRLMWLEPLVTKTAPPAKKVEFYKRNMEQNCDLVEKFWLADKPFLCGDEITIADLFAAAELEQPKLTGYDVRDGRPFLSAWLERVRTITSPHYDAVHNEINRIASKYNGQCPALVGKQEANR